MARIIDGPREKRVVCNACGATIGYFPEDVKMRRGRDIDGGGNGDDYVKCPRPKCFGEGIIRSW